MWHTERPVSITSYCNQKKEKCYHGGILAALSCLDSKPLFIFIVSCQKWTGVKMQHTQIAKFQHFSATSHSDSIDFCFLLSIITGKLQRTNLRTHNHKELKPCVHIYWHTDHKQGATWVPISSPLVRYTELAAAGFSHHCAKHFFFSHQRFSPDNGRMAFRRCCTNKCPSSGSVVTGHYFCHPPTS